MFLRVTSSPAACAANADYTTISAAVAAAEPDDTISVCAGTFLESVNVDVADLTFMGARAGKSPVKKLPKPGTQTVVQDTGGGFDTQSSGDNVVIDGFTVKDAGIDYTGDASTSGSSPATGILVSHNKSTNDSTFLVAIDTSNALVEENTVTSGAAATGGLGDAILDFGSNTGLQVLDKTIKATGGTNSPYTQAGVHIANYTGTPSTDTTVSGNTITGYYYGLELDSSATTNDFPSNTIIGSTEVGMNAQPRTSQNVISHNTVSGSPDPAMDCSDATPGVPFPTGSRTPGNNTGKDKNSSPAGICP